MTFTNEMKADLCNLERSAPTSACVFCSVEENRDRHFTGRCTRFPDSVSRTAQTWQLLLCLRCLKPSYQDDCGVKCGGCGLDHKSLLCTQRWACNGNPMKRPHNFRLQLLQVDFMGSRFQIGNIDHGRWRCPFLHVVPLETARAKLITDIRMQATGPCDRPAYEDPCHITWCMTVQVSRDGATASAGVEAHSQSPASVRSMRGSLMRGRHRGATEPHVTSHG
ncbi:unnamed protein product [Heligmosomoides polygyrus]|uniref:Phorbol-ester/DAG-type domain-containing protein n=1 Tax=Heligmosomoides polygyrus TaxID=6339 RepID=A0A183GBQ2_HELPZ|nr:unnamed protein product [Heligmosomoides polygyrus]